MQHPRALLISALMGAALVAAFAGAAQAQIFSVTSANKNFCCNNPGIIALNPHTATGYVTATPQTKYGPIQIGASQVFNWMNFMSWWSDYPANGTMLPPTGFKYVIGTNSAVNEAATLQSGGGYGAFEFCPKAKGPGVGACANPGLATPASFNGRIAVTAGPNKFGGTMRLLAGAGGKGDTFSDVWRWIGGSMTYPAAVVYNAIYSSVVGGAPAANKTVMASSQLVTHTPGSNPYTFQSFSQAVLWENGGGPWTTGTIYVGVTTNGTPSTRTLTVMGGNNRTAGGGGNIQVVSGLLFNTFNNIKNASFPIGYQLDMTLPEPSPSLGLAAGGLALAGLGLFGTRRRNRK